MDLGQKYSQIEVIEQRNDDDETKIGKKRSMLKAAPSRL